MELSTIASSVVFSLGMFIEYIGIFIVVASVVVALNQFLFKGDTRENTRVELAKNIIFGLEFVIAADILLVTVAVSFDQILQLGGIVVIRVLLGYALQRENIK